jgi:hypothetical protein
MDERMASAMPGRQGGQALGVEAGDQVRDGIAGTTAGRAGGGLVVVTPGDGQEHGGSGDLDGGCGLGPAETSECLAFDISERAERIHLAAGHR